MKNLFFILCGGLLACSPTLSHAQGKAPVAKTPAAPGAAKPVAAKPAGVAAAKGAPVAKAAASTASEALPAHTVALAPETPKADPTALKIKAEVNPTTKQLAVHTNVPGPTTIEVNDVSGRPVLTCNVIAGSKPIELNVSQLPAGYYVVHCTAGLRSSLRRIHLE